MPHRRLLFSTPSYDPLADGIAVGAFERAAIDVKRFPDGERHLQLQRSVEGRDVVLVGGTGSDEDTLLVYDLASTLVGAGAERLTIVIPYFGYSTMERATAYGEVVTAKTRARLLSSIPPAPGGNRILLVDPHSDGLPFYFEGSVRTTNVRTSEVIREAVRRIGGDEFTVASADVGGTKRVHALARELDRPAGFVLKHRISGDRTEIVAALADPVRRRRVVIVDDMIRTGGSLIDAARAYRAAGAASIAAVATHGVLPDGALDRLQNSGLFTGIVCTDSHPSATRQAGTFLSIEPLAPLLARVLGG